MINLKELSGCIHYQIKPCLKLALEVRHKQDGRPFISGNQIRGKDFYAVPAQPILSRIIRLLMIVTKENSRSLLRYVQLK